MATQAYLKSNQDVLEECVTDGLKELLKNKPAAPLQFMADYFAKRHQEKTHAPHVSWPSQGPVPDFVARVTTAAGKAAQEHQQKLEKKAAGEPSWDCQAWLAAEGCSDMLENLLLGPLKKKMNKQGVHQRDIGTLELELIRALSKEQDCRAVVLSLLQHSDSLQLIADFITKKITKLMAAAAESGRALNTKFVEEFHSDEMAFGGQATFFQGLDGLIGPPNPNLLEGMRTEHCSPHCELKDSSESFKTSNYGITTTSYVEYLMVVEPDSLWPDRKPQYSGLELPSDIQKLIDEGKLLRRTSSGAFPELADEDRVGVRWMKPPAAFMAKFFAQNEQLEDRDLAKLQLEEFHAARLYSGPMYMKYNAVLRGLPKLVPYLFKRMEELCKDNRYETTLHCINSAIVKMSRLAKPQTVYRGIAGRVLPAQFWRGAGHGGVEFAFMSTTADRTVAMQYAKGSQQSKASTVMEIKMGMIDRGADLAWLSQYPEEKEITFPPFTGLEVATTDVEDSVLIVNLRLNVNLMSPTIEESINKMQKAHLQLLDTIHSNLRAAHSPKRLLLSLKGLLGAEKGKEAEFFNRVENFHTATEMALETQHEAFIALHEKSLWEREYQEERGVIPEKMRLAAAMCARVGEHEVALSLLRQALERDRSKSVDTKSTDFHGQMVLAKASLWQKGHLDKLDEQLNQVVEQVSSENDIDDAEKWKLGLAGRLIQLGVPSPWPATLCRLATSTGVAESTGELSESLRSDDTTCDAIIAVVKAALSKQLAADHFGDAVGLKGLSKDAHVLVSVTTQVGGVGTSQVWRKAQAESIRSGGLIGPHRATITVDAPKGDKSPTITLNKGYTYEVEWTTTPEPGEYVISELAVGGKYGQVQIAKEAGSKAVGSFANPPEAYLTVAMREGSGTREFSAAEIARGEVLVMPSPNPTVSSGAGAVLREAAAMGNLKLLKALLEVGVSVWEADPTATTAVHLAARKGQEKTFDLLWKVPPKEDSKLVGPTLAFLTLRNNDGKRALDFIFESGSTKLARLTRGDASDVEMKKLKEEEPEALQWTDALLAVERKAIGSREQSPRTPARKSGSKGSFSGASPGFDRSKSFRSSEDQNMLRDTAAKVTKGGITALMLACRLGDLGDAYACVRALLIAKADPKSASGEHGLTALHVAAESPLPEIQLRNPWSLRCPTHVLTPMPLPTPVDGYEEVLELLAKNLGQGQVDLKLKDGKTALMLACKNGNAESAEELLKYGADPTLQEVFDMKDVDGFSAIMHAALYGHDKCIAVVLSHAKQRLEDGEMTRTSTKMKEAGPVRAVNKNGDTALHLASLFGQRKVVQLLLRERADVNALNTKGESALHNASKSGHAQVVCALLTGGAEVDQQDPAHGYTALHYCCTTNGGKDVADALMEVGAKVDLVGKDGNTPLHLACMSGNHRIVDVLRKKKADVAARNGAGQVPFEVAAKAGHDNVKDKLQPVRQNLESHMPRIHSVKLFKEARAFVRAYGLQRLKHELIAPGFVDPKTYTLTTSPPPFNPFAMVGAGKVPAHKEDNAALAQAPGGAAYAERFMVARNLPDNDKHWESNEKQWVGKASMSERHRFMIIKKPADDKQVRPATATLEEARMTYFWTWFNILTMGLVDGLPDNANDFDEDELKRVEADPAKNKATLEEALECLKMMRAAALAFVEQDRPTNGWSQNIGLFFHCYPHCSVNSTHMHILDMDRTGPSYEAIKSRNLKMDFVIQAMEEEIKELHVDDASA